MPRGSERYDPDAVGREMALLAPLAYRIVWVNPRQAAEGYGPVAGGIAAALPHCDAFVSGHGIDALAEAIRAIGDPTAPTRRLYRSDESGLAATARRFAGGGLSHERRAR